MNPLNSDQRQGMDDHHADAMSGPTECAHDDIREGRRVHTRGHNDSHPALDETIATLDETTATLDETTATLDETTATLDETTATPPSTID